MQVTFEQVNAMVPVWNILFEGEDIGCVTCFPGEGPMATVRLDGETRTVKGATVALCQEAAANAFWDLHNDPDYDYIEDEDGDIAFARMLERRAEGPFGYYDEEPW